VPKAHANRLADLDAADSRAVFDLVHELAPHVEDAVDADALNVGVNDGEAAGQEVPHVHVHLVPRFEDDGGRPIHAVAGERPHLSEDELDRIADDVAANRRDENH